MKKMTMKLFSISAFLVLALSFVSCKKKGVAGRTFQGIYDDSFITVEFDDDGFANMTIGDDVRVVFNYEIEDKDKISVYVASRPAEEYEWKYDDNFLWIPSYDGENEIELEDLDKKLAANHAARGSDW